MGRPFDVSQDKTWVDPLVGLTLRSPREHRLHAQVYAEIGGFGAGSDFTWQILPTVGFKFTDRAGVIHENVIRRLHQFAAFPFR